MAGRRLSGTTLLAVALGGCSGAPPPPPVQALPPIRHVFVLLLENQSYVVTFGRQSAAPYLARTLPAQGALLTQYYAIQNGGCSGPYSTGYNSDTYPVFNDIFDFDALAYNPRDSSIWAGSCRATTRQLRTA